MQSVAMRAPTSGRWRLWVGRPGRWRPAWPASFASISLASQVLTSRFCCVAYRVSPSGRRLTRSRASTGTGPHSVNRTGTRRHPSAVHDLSPNASQPRPPAVAHWRIDRQCARVSTACSMWRAVLRLREGVHASDALERADDVFFLSRTELEQPATDLRETVRRRRDERQRQRRLVAPLELGHPPRLLKALLSGAAPVVRRTDVTRDVLIGQGASPGRATGRVRIVNSVQDFDAFEPGEVLVARATAPAWTPLFERAAAVVTDGGTLAAHASLVAREYGIPAVVGTGDATRRLKTGHMVTVDGTAGTVEIVDG